MNSQLFIEFTSFTSFIESTAALLQFWGQIYAKIWLSRVHHSQISCWYLQYLTKSALKGESAMLTNEICTFYLLFGNSTLIHTHFMTFVVTTFRSNKVDPLSSPPLPTVPSPPPHTYCLPSTFYLLLWEIESSLPLGRNANRIITSTFFRWRFTMKTHLRDTRGSDSDKPSGKAIFSFFMLKKLYILLKV